MDLWLWATMLKTHQTRAKADLTKHNTFRNRQLIFNHLWKWIQFIKDHSYKRFSMRIIVGRTLELTLNTQGTQMVILQAQARTNRIRLIWKTLNTLFQIIWSIGSQKRLKRSPRWTKLRLLASSILQMMKKASKLAIRTRSISRTKWIGWTWPLITQVDFKA